MPVGESENIIEIGGINEMKEMAKASQRKHGYLQLLKAWRLAVAKAGVIYRQHQLAAWRYGIAKSSR
jgi:hypothetical protein